jgi:hypothetical protein
MAVPSSGELKLWDSLWNQELAGSQGENSLHSASVYAGFSTPDALSDFYGWSDVEVPTVQTNAMSSIEYYRMYANGQVNATGNENPDRGFYFGTNANDYSGNSKYSVGTGGTGAFSRNMDSQVNEYNVTYYAWAYASNSAGEAVGSRVQGTTPYPPFSPSLNLNHSANNCFQGSTSHVGYVNPYSSTVVTYFNGPGYTRYNPFANNARTQSTANNTATFLGARQFAWSPQQPYSSVQAQHTGVPETSQVTSTCMRGSTDGPGRVRWRFCPSDIRLKTNITYL